MLPAILGIALILLNPVCRVSGFQSIKRGSSTRRQYSQLEKGWSRVYTVTDKDLEEMKEEVETAFQDTYDNYMTYAFPMDDLLPISCQGKNTHGGLAMTLLDSLDTLIVLNKTQEFQLALQKIERYVSFDIDDLVRVFEVNIRAVGGLLSAHILIQRNPDLAPNYTDSLLKAALDLATRLLPAFDTETGIPRSEVNLKSGTTKDANGRESNVGDVTCCACGGTHVLEMGMLSRLTGQTIFEEKAKTALYALFNLRSVLGLLGNTVHVQDYRWTRLDSSIGAGADSIHEYLLKAYMLFGDVEYLTMFTELYSAVMQHMKTPRLSGGYVWIADVHTDEGYFLQPWISSLSAFWPGMQALAGQFEDAIHLHGNYTAIWMKFAALPEKFSVSGKSIHPRETGYPLRPEFIESTYILHSCTKDPHYLQIGRILQKSLLSTKASGCGFANIADVSTGELSDHMESFFLSESLKYLYLLQSNVTSFIDAFVFTTEAHIFPPVYNSIPQSPHLEFFPTECSDLCQVLSVSERQEMIEEIREKFPLLRPSVVDLEVIQSRRCNACVHITSEIKKTPKNLPEEVIEKMTIQWGLSPSEEDEQEEEEEDGALASSSEQVASSVHSRTLPYETVAVCKCILASSEKQVGLSCVKMEACSSKADEIALGMINLRQTVLIRKVVPHNARRQGRLVLAFDTQWKEFKGIFHQHSGMAPADKPSSQNCPSIVLKSFNLAEKEKVSNYNLKDCQKQLISGKIVLADPISACHRILNAKEMKKSIVVISQKACDILQKLKNIRNAGAVGVIMMKSTEEENEWMYDFTHYVSGIPVFLISPKDAQEMMEIWDSHRVVYGMMGKSTSSLMHCPPLHSLLFNELSKGSDDVSKVEVLVPKNTLQYLKTTTLQGLYSYTDVQGFITQLAKSRKVIDALNQVERTYVHREL